MNIIHSSSQAVGGDSKLAVSFGATVQQDLYAAVSAASSWLDAAENQLLSGPVLLSEDTETQLANLEVSGNKHTNQFSLLLQKYKTNIEITAKSECTKCSKLTKTLDRIYLLCH